MPLDRLPLPALTPRAMIRPVLLALATSLTGCSSGFYAATGLQGASGNGANANLGDLQIRQHEQIKKAAGKQPKKAAGCSSCNKKGK